MELNKNNQFEINDLIDDAVNNAITRRNEALDSLENLSDEETNNITGGASLKISPIILGLIYYPPCTTIGIIAVDPKIQTI